MKLGPRIRGFMIATVVAGVLVPVTAPSNADVASSPSPPASPLRVFVVVVDGLNPSEVGLLTPNLSALKRSGTWYEEARGVLVAETIPNHVAMATGVLPHTSGVVANSFIPTGAAEPRDADSPDLVEVPTIVTRIESECPAVDTATVMSKTYLHGVFDGGGQQRRADFHWQPFPIIPQSEHAPDLFTMQALLGWLPTAGPHAFAFVNLGDVDRMGHADETGSVSPAVARQAAIIHTDAQVGRFVGELKRSGLWSSSVLMIVSDHGMDWSLPTRFVSLTPALEAAGLVPGPPPAGDFQIAQNGGADLVYVHDAVDVPRVAQVVRSVQGVGLVLDTPQQRARYGLDHEAAGDILAFAARGWRFSDPSLQSNPLPGNHGHPVTQHTVLLLTGGHPSLPQGPSLVPPSSAPPTPPDLVPGNLSVAPTVAELFGLEADGEFDRPPLPVQPPNPAPCSTPAPG